MPWQLLVADSYHSYSSDEDPNGETVEVHGIKCWDSNKMVKIALECLPSHFNIISLSTGHFKLYPTEQEHIVVAIVGIFEKKEASLETTRVNKMINFYENKHFGTEKDLSDLSEDVGTLINAITLNENIIPYRLVQKSLTPSLNSFILLTNQGCFPIVSKSVQEGSKMEFEIMADSDWMSRVTPEFEQMDDHGATLAIDIKLTNDKSHRNTCIGYENGYCALFVVEIKDDHSILKKKFDQYYSATIAAILFLNSQQLLVAPMWEGVVFYPDVSNGFDVAEFVERSNEFDAVTSLCNAKRLDGTGFCIGTFGKRLLVYKIEKTKRTINCSSYCKLKWNRKFRYPILQLRSFDITGDGLQDIAVLSSGGLHLLQVNYRLVIQKLIGQINIKTNENLMKKETETVLPENSDNDILNDNKTELS